MGIRSVVCMALGAFAAPGVAAQEPWAPPGPAEFGIRFAYGAALARSRGDAIGIGPDLVVDRVSEAFLALVALVERELAEELVRACGENNPEVQFTWDLVAGVDPDARRATLGPLVPQGYAWAWPRSAIGWRLEASQFAYDRAARTTAEPAGVGMLRGLLAHLWGGADPVTRGFAPFLDGENWREMEDALAFSRTPGCLPTILVALGASERTAGHRLTHLLRDLRDWQALPVPDTAPHSDSLPGISATSQPVYVLGDAARWQALQRVVGELTGVRQSLAARGPAADRTRARRLDEIDRWLESTALLCAIALRHRAGADDRLRDGDEFAAFRGACFEPGSLVWRPTHPPVCSRLRAAQDGTRVLAFEFTEEPERIGPAGRGIQRAYWDGFLHDGSVTAITPDLAVDQLTEALMTVATLASPAERDVLFGAGGVPAVGGGGCVAGIAVALSDARCEGSYMRALASWPQGLRKHIIVPDGPPGPEPLTEVLPIHFVGSASRWQALQAAAEALRPILAAVLTRTRDAGHAPSLVLELDLTELTRKGVADLCTLALRHLDGKALQDPEEHRAAMYACWPHHNRGLVQDGRTLLPVATRVFHPAGTTALGFVFTAGD